MMAAKEYQREWVMNRRKEEGGKNERNAEPTSQVHQRVVGQDPR